MERLVGKGRLEQLHVLLCYLYTAKSQARSSRVINATIENASTPTIYFGARIKTIFSMHAKRGFFSAKIKHIVFVAMSLRQPTQVFEKILELDIAKLVRDFTITKG